MITGIQVDQDTLILGATGSLGTGHYMGQYNSRTNQTSLTVEPVREDVLVFGANDPALMLSKSIEDWFSKKDLYRSMGLNHRRGILLYGPPGGGKTATLIQLKRDFVAHGGLTVSGIHPSYMGKVALAIRGLDKTIPIMFAVDDMEYERNDNMLRFLDGENSLDGIVVVATTNFYSQFDPAYKRPSRFDSRVLIEYPAKETVVAFLEAKSGADLIPEVLNMYPRNDSKRTFKMHPVLQSIANVKEYLLLRKIYGRSASEAQAEMEVVPSYTLEVSELGGLNKEDRAPPWTLTYEEQG